MMMRTNILQTILKNSNYNLSLFSVLCVIINVPYPWSF